VNTVWFVVVLGLVAAVGGVITSLRRGDRLSDLGTVSHQWMAEHRPGSGQDSRR
jgi:hypothetical protein